MSPARTLVAGEMPAGSTWPPQHLQQVGRLMIVCRDIEIVCHEICAELIGHADPAVAGVVVGEPSSEELMRLTERLAKHRQWNDARQQSLAWILADARFVFGFRKMAAHRAGGWQADGLWFNAPPGTTMARTFLALEELEALSQRAEGLALQLRRVKGNLPVQKSTLTPAA